MKKNFFIVGMMVGLMGSTQTLVAETGDFNGDSYSDIIWKQDSGNNSIWFMNSSGEKAGADFLALPTWSVQPSMSCENSKYYDIHFPIDGVNYSGVSVDESGLSAGARQLAAQCAQCHGTYGVAVADWPDLWGTGRGITKWMKDYQDPSYDDISMHLHALAYTDEEVLLIKEYYDNVTYTEGGE